MKKIYLFLCIGLLGMSCQEKYTFSSDFSTPTTLTSPAEVVLDVTSTSTINLSWEGGGAADGGTVIYEVLFDKVTGDFSTPIVRMFSDLRSLPTLTLSHAELNGITRTAGIKPDETADIKWTVFTSKGGEVRPTDVTKTISVTRGEGIDNIPTEMYLMGTGTEDGQPTKFRTVEEGIYVIYTKTQSGSVKFRSSTSTDAFEYVYTDGKFSEGEGDYATAATTTPLRITVNLNTLSLKTEAIASRVKMIWGVTFSEIALLDYTNGGKFVGNGRVRFIDPSRPDTNPPSWLGWVEDRYYFVATVDGTEKCWGRGDGVSGEKPSDNESAPFYALYEFAWSQWDHLWKMSNALDDKTCTVTIDTNDNNLKVHKFSNIQPI